jgi:hypothetical protein
VTICEGIGEGGDQYIRFRLPMIGQGLGPGTNFGWRRLKVDTLERQAKAARHDAITIRAPRSLH